MTDKLLDDDVKILRRQIDEGKPYGEVINFMVNQLGLTHQEAQDVYERLACEDQPMTTITRERVAEIIHAAGLEPCDYEDVFCSIKTGEIVAMARIALASLEAEPDYALHRDANRYRFLRDKDAFGDENAPGLVSWDGLAELDAGDFDAAVDERVLSCDIPQYILTEAQERTATAGVYAELYRLRDEIKGPDGFDTWKDAAIAERKARVELEMAGHQVRAIDYLGAMAAFHSDEWHKMGPISGYMHGWNACRAAMLHGAEQPQNAQQNIPNNIPCWIKCSERMPEQKVGVLVACEMDGPGDWRMKWASYIPEHPDAIYGWLIPGASWKPTHWMPLPAAPQQEQSNG